MCCLVKPISLCDADIYWKVSKTRACGDSACRPSRVPGKVVSTCHRHWSLMRQWLNTGISLVQQRCHRVATWRHNRAFAWTYCRLGRRMSAAGSHRHALPPTRSLRRHDIRPIYSSDGQSVGNFTACDNYCKCGRPTLSMYSSIVTNSIRLRCLVLLHRYSDRAPACVHVCKV